MSEKRVLRKMKKLASRIGDKMETVRDVMEDLEIEFEILQKQIVKLESKKGIESTDESKEEIDFDDESDETLDLENTSVVTVRPKFSAFNAIEFYPRHHSCRVFKRYSPQMIRNDFCDTKTRNRAMAFK